MARNYIVLDTETADTVKWGDNKAHPETSLVYDLGWVVVSGDTGAVLKKRSFVIAETYTNINLMQSAYYYDKIETFYQGNVIAGSCADDPKDGWIMLSFLEAYQCFKHDLIDYDVKTVWAYNARFDEQVLNNTIETYSNGFMRWFKPYKVQFRDIWDYASNITGTKKYVQWAINHGYVSAKGNPSTSAETVYRYLTDDNEFIEDHTARSDAEIEAAILWESKRKHKKTRHSKGQGWRDASRVAHELYEENMN